MTRMMDENRFLSDYLFSRSVVCHVTGSRAKLGISFDNFVYGFKEILLRCNLKNKQRQNTSSIEL